MSAVRDILVTHWHDDHHAGVAELLRNCEQARFWCSAALRTEEFKRLAEAARNRISNGTGVDEFADVLRIIKSRLQKGARKAGSGPLWVSARTLLIRSGTIEVLALSPSATEQTLAKQELAEQVPELRSRGRKLVRRHPNHVSVVLHLRLGSHTVLLGSDLEVGRDPGIGWSGVASVSQDLSCERCHLLKVPHHGSVTGHHPAIWEELARQDCHAVVTPFRSSGLPSTLDIQRLLSHTARLACTARASGAKPRSRVASVEKSMRQAVTSRRTLTSDLGHVRYRGKLASPELLSLELFGQAHVPVQTQ